MLFNMAELGSLDRPLTPKVLSNPNHKITRHILYLYSMESFIYDELNQTTRNKDKKKVKFYGAYAAALSYIINVANSQRKSDKLSGSTFLYRGLKLT